MKQEETNNQKPSDRAVEPELATASCSDHHAVIRADNRERWLRDAADDAEVRFKAKLEEARQLRLKRAITYVLTDKAKDTLTFKEWRNMGGCGLPGGATVNVTSRLQEKKENWEDRKLRDIADACVVADRTMGRWAIVELKRYDLADIEPPRIY